MFSNANSVPFVQLLCNTQSSKEAQLQAVSQMAAARFVLLTYIVEVLQIPHPSCSPDCFRQGKLKNASLTEQPANQLRLAYRLEEKLRVYVLPRSMLCCCIFKSGRSGPMSFSLFLSPSDRRFESFQSAYSQNQSLCQLCCSRRYVRCIRDVKE